MLGGATNIPNAIEKALLALKHRSNKNLRQRIVVFVGSPLEGQAADDKFMVKLAKRLKKNNVAVDFIAFGDGIEEGERSILKTFIDNVSSADNRSVAASHFTRTLSAESLTSRRTVITSLSLLAHIYCPT